MRHSTVLTGRTIWIREARLLCPAGGIDRPGDLFLRDGRLGFGKPDGAVDRVVDAEGLVATPGFLEIHAHLREPGDDESETIRSGLEAALAGGFTAVVSMANTNPRNDCPEVTRAMLESAKASGVPVRLLPAAAATVGMEGRLPADYAAQKAAGAVAVTDDGFPVLDDDVMAECMARASQVGLPILDHATHGPKSGKGVIHDGEAARRLGLEGLPREEEDHLVERDIRLAEAGGHSIHIQHISSAVALRAVREAKARGVRVTAEAAPHHLLLTEADVTGPEHKMNPPIREESDRRALIEGLQDGTIDAVATDHAPHAPARKARGLRDAPFGVIGMESAFPVLHDRLVREGLVDLDLLVRLLTVGPARVLGLEAPALVPGGRAELNLLDLETPYVFDESCLRSKSRNCPFLGLTLRGRVAATAASGRLFVHDPERFRSGRM